MKQLTKLKLKDFSEMTDNEMKRTIGGVDDGNECDGTSGACT